MEEKDEDKGQKENGRLELHALVHSCLASLYRVATMQGGERRLLAKATAVVTSQKRCRGGRTRGIGCNVRVRVREK